MSTSSHILRFDRPLQNVIYRRADGPAFTREEVAKIRREAHEEGKLAQRAFTDSQIAELRTDVQALQRGLFEQLETLDARLLAELQRHLPDLVVDLARRLLADYQPTPEQVKALCLATMDELLPAKDGLELSVSEADARSLGGIEGEWANEFPGLKLRTDHSLQSGECMVKSRFGIVDGRFATRLEALGDELQGESRS